MTREEARRVYEIIRMAQDAAILSAVSKGLQNYETLEFMGDKLEADARIQYETWAQALENLTQMTIEELKQGE